MRERRLGKLGHINEPPDPRLDALFCVQEGWGFLIFERGPPAILLASLDNCALIPRFTWACNPEQRAPVREYCRQLRDLARMQAAAERLGKSPSH